MHVGGHVQYAFVMQMAAEADAGVHLRLYRTNAGYCSLFACAMPLGRKECWLHQ